MDQRDHEDQRMKGERTRERDLFWGGIVELRRRV